MIVRIEFDIVTLDEIPVYIEDLRRAIVPLYTGAVGLLSFSILQRELVAYGEIAVISTWESQEAMLAFFQKQIPNSAIPKGVIRRDPLVYHIVYHALVKT